MDSMLHRGELLQLYFIAVLHNILTVALGKCVPVEVHDGVLGIPTTAGG